MDKFYQWFDYEGMIKTNNSLFVHLKSSCQYTFTRKTMASTEKWRLKQE